MKITFSRVVYNVDSTQQGHIVTIPKGTKAISIKVRIVNTDWWQGVAKLKINGSDLLAINYASGSSTTGSGSIMTYLNIDTDTTFDIDIYIQQIVQVVDMLVEYFILMRLFCLNKRE